MVKVSRKKVSLVLFSYVSILLGEPPKSSKPQATSQNANQLRLCITSEGKLTYNCPPPEKNTNKTSSITSSSKSEANRDPGFYGSAGNTPHAKSNYNSPYGGMSPNPNGAGVDHDSIYRQKLERDAEQIERNIQEVRRQADFRNYFEKQQQERDLQAEQIKSSMEKGRAEAQAIGSTCHILSKQYLSVLQKDQLAQAHAFDTSKQNISTFFNETLLEIEKELQLVQSVNEKNEPKIDNLSIAQTQLLQSNKIKPNFVIESLLPKHPLNTILSASTQRHWQGTKTEDNAEVYNVANTLLDIAIGITPLVGTTRDIAEAVTGINVLTGQPLNKWERGFVIASALTLGALSGVKLAKALPAIEKLGEPLKNIIKTEKISESIPIAERMLDSEKAIQHFTPINPGPLHSITQGSGTVADTFRSGSYNMRVLKNEEIFYRLAPEEEKLKGRFWTPLYPSGKLQDKMDFALIPEFENNASWRGTLKLPKGTIIYEGVTASQEGLSGARYLGGAPQVYIEIPPDLEGKIIKEKIK